MRSRALPALVGVATLAIATALTGTASAASGPTAASHGASTAARVLDGPACKGGANMGTPNGDGITAQTFEAGFEAYDSFGGADFKMKKKCKVASVYVEGTTSTGGATEGAHIAIMKDKGGLPDKSRVVCEKDVDTGGAVGSYKAPFKCTVPKGKGWLVVTTMQNFGTSGQWYWGTTNESVGVPDAWKNPGGGFGVGCTDWGKLGTCLGFPDYAYIFALQKK